MESYKKFRGEFGCRFAGAESEKEVFVQKTRFTILEWVLQHLDDSL